MKTITRFASVVVAAACAPCATHEPATSSTAPQLAALRKTPGGDYPGYQCTVLEDGQARYCRKNLATGSNTERRVNCLTESQLWAEQLAALEQLRAQHEESRRPGTIQLENQENWQAMAQSAAVNMPVNPPVRQH